MKFDDAGNVKIIFWEMVKDLDGREVVLAQLVERSLPTPEIDGSNPNNGKILSTNCTFYKKRGKSEKEAGNGPS